MARRSDHTREELKESVFNAAWTIVAEEGLEALTARRIAKAIGYAPGTIYNLYDSMDDLYLQMNSKTLDLLYDRLSLFACISSKEEAAQDMKKMALDYMRFADENRAFWLMLFNLKVTEHRSDAGWYHDKVERLFLPLENLLIPFYRDNQIKERKIATRILWSSVHGLCFLQETDKLILMTNQSSIEEMVNILVETFLRGIA